MFTSPEKLIPRSKVLLAEDQVGTVASSIAKKIIIKLHLIVIINSSRITLSFLQDATLNIVIYNS